MPIVSDILSLLAINLGYTSISDLTVNGFDLGTFSINAAKRLAEREHDFKQSELNCYLSIGASGGVLSSAYVNTGVTVTGTLSPNVAVAFALSGTYNSLPFYTATVSSVVYFISYNGTQWTITAGGFTLGSNYWSLTTTSTSPAGAYTAHGANTGVATVAATIGGVAVKRVAMVSLPVAGDYEPIEFLTNDEYLGRLRRQIGRQNYDPTKGFSDLGVSFKNPLAYQNANTLFLYPGNLTLPIVAQLNVVQFLPAYTAGTDSDFFTQNGSEYLLWQGVLFANKWARRFIPKQENNVSETEIQGMADAALQAFITYDISTERSTSTPNAQADPAR